MSDSAERPTGVTVPMWLYRPVWLALQPVLRLLIGWRVTGREHVPTEGGLLLVSNHLHNADPVVLYLALPRPICYMAKVELFRNPIARAAIMAWGAFPIDRGGADRQAMKQALDLVQDGWIVGMFPEGTRSRTHTLDRGHPGLGLLIARSGATVLPVAITGSERPARLWPRPVMAVNIGKPIRFTAPPGGRLDHQEVVDRVMTEIALLLPVAYRGHYAAMAAEREAGGLLATATVTDSSGATTETGRVTTTDCCIVGGGPAGALLALQLARQGIATTLLEAHHDFDRDFRGDTLHPSVLEIMDELGLADRLLELPHAKLPRMSFMGAAGSVTVVDFSLLPSRFPYIMMLPQVRFLNFLVDEARRYPAFRLVMGARVEALVERDGVVRGVRYHADDGWHTVEAMLTVGADGRFSRIRQLAGLALVRAAPSIDVLWLRLPRRPQDPVGSGGIANVANGHMAVALEREHDWQIAYVIPSGRYQELRAAGLATLRGSIAALLPRFADRVDDLTDWHQVSLLSVESSRVTRWYEPGLLLIGDAAHVMSPIGGIGINYAIMDAVAAANRLVDPLRSGNVAVDDLAAIQRRREMPTRVIQALQTALQQRLLPSVMQANSTFQLPPFLRALPRIPLLRRLPAQLIGYGLRREHIRPDLRLAKSPSPPDSHAGADVHPGDVQ